MQTQGCLRYWRQRGGTIEQRVDKFALLYRLGHEAVGPGAQRQDDGGEAVGIGDHDDPRLGAGLA